MKKRYSYFCLIIILCFFFGVTSVKALIGEIKIENADDDIKNSTLICDYELTFYNASYNDKTMSIYYENGKWAIVFIDQDKGDKQIKGFDSFSRTFSKNAGENVYFYSSKTENNFTCPDYAHIEYQSFTEMCFDNGGENGKISYLESSCATKHKYEFNDKKYASTGSTLKSSIFEIMGKDLAIWLKNASSSTTATDLDNYISSKYFNGSGVPAFVKNNDVYKNTVKNLSSGNVGTTSTAGETVAPINGTGTTGGASGGAGTTGGSGTTDGTGDGAGTTGGSGTTGSERQEYPESYNCRYLLGDPDNSAYPAYWLQFCLKIIKYIGVIAMLGLSFMDFFKAIIASDKEATKKATMTTAKRFVFMVLLFFLPILVDVLMKLLGAYGTCGIG